MKKYIRQIFVFMKNSSLTFIAGSFIILLCISFNQAKEPVIPRSTLKILSYNVRNCRGMDDKTDYKRVAEVITRISPDIVALQELDSATQRSNGKVVLNELASLTGMYETYSASVSYQGGKYGIGILTREKPVSWEIIRLPGSEERRSLLILELKNLVICCTHFSLTEEDRLASVKIINAALKKFSKPVFLAGDFNAVPESEVIKSIGHDWYMLNNPAKPTIPSDDPKRCIDYIFAANFTGHKFETIQTVVEPESVASDHLPVWVEVKIK
jgi:endonuclease/exonuclease/phosphatase family metal-dependent hydrolase